MRKLMWFSLGFGVACAACAYLLPADIVILCAAVFACVCAGLWFGCSRLGLNKRVLYVAVGLLAALSWFATYDLAYLQNARAADGKTRFVTLTATDYGVFMDYGAAVDAEVTLGDRTYDVRAFLDEKVTIAPGDSISGTFSFRCTVPGGSAEPTYHGGNGTFLLAYAEGEVQHVHADEKANRYFASRLRRNILQMIDALFSDDTAPFVKALLLGDTSDLDYATNTHLSISGIRHVAAVSGLHVSILFSLVYFVTAKRRLLTVFLGLPCLLLFAAVAGFSPSVTRACIMQGLMLVSLGMKKEYDPPTALAFAALVILIVNPLTITSVSFQLSVGSVAGILLFTPKLQNWLLDAKRIGKFHYKTFKGRLLRGVALSVSVTLGAMSVTAPLSAWYFGTLSLIGVVTNLLCLWVITFLFCGIIAACVIGIWLASVAELLAAGLSWIVRYILFVSGTLAKLPGAAVYTESMWIVIWIVVCYVLLAVFLLSNKKRPVQLISCMVSGLCIAMLLSISSPFIGTYCVGVLDVGQGQCVFLHSAGRTYMVDCGSDDPEEAADRAASYLNSRGIYRLDGVIVTHYDKDHVGAVPYLLSRVDTDVIILPQGQDIQRWSVRIEEETDAEQMLASTDLEIAWGDAMISVFSSQNTNNSNESSLCILFHTENCDILITGDRSVSGELELLSNARIPRLTALVVGHHGSSSATSAYLLRATTPQIAVISVGKDNNFGLPDASVVQRLRASGCEIRRTDQEGTIVLRG